MRRSVSLLAACATTLLLGACASTTPASAPAGLKVAVDPVAHPAGETPQWWYRSGASQAAANGAMSGKAKNVILFLGEPPVPQVAELTARLIGRFSFGLYASEGYLKRHGSPGSPAELRSHDLIGYQSGESLMLWNLRDDTKEFSLQPHPRFLTNDYWVAKLAAVHDHGICLIPTFFADAEVEAGLLKPVLPDWRSKEVPMYALFASHRLQNPSLRLMINSLTENFSDLFSYPYQITRNEAFRRIVHP